MLGRPFRGWARSRFTVCFFSIDRFGQDALRHHFLLVLLRANSIIAPMGGRSVIERTSVGDPLTNVAAEDRILQCWSLIFSPSQLGSQFHARCEPRSSGSERTEGGCGGRFHFDSSSLVQRHLASWGCSSTE